MTCNKYLQHRCADDGTLIADVDPQNILELLNDGGYSFSDPIFAYYIFTTYNSIIMWYRLTSMI